MAFTISSEDFHASLTDGVDKLGIKFCDLQGNINSRYLKVQPYPRTALKTSSGQSKYADLEPPYMSIAQDSWLGGMGSADYESDTSKYYESRGVTVLGSGLINGPEILFATNWADSEATNWPTSSAFTYRQRELIGTSYYSASKFVAPATTSDWNFYFYVRRVGTPGAGLALAVYSDSGDNPNAVIGVVNTVVVTTSTVPDDGVFHLFQTGDFPGISLTSGTTYWLVIRGAGSGANDASNHWEILANSAAGDGRISSNGSSWTSAAPLMYRIYWVEPHIEDFGKFKFFEYKGGMYCGFRSGSDYYIWLNGDRGAADDNSANTAKLNDATKTWTPDEWIGAYVVIVGGAGVDITQPWRKIVDNDATSLTVSPAFGLAQDTTTEYVIIGTSKWQLWQTISTTYAHDVETGGDFVYFARGENANVLRYQEYNNGGTWTIRTAAEDFKATQIKAVRHPTHGQVLWFGRNRHPLWGNAVGFGQVPVALGDLYQDLGVVCDTDKPWDGRSITNVTQSTTDGHTKIAVAAGFTTGIIAVENLSEAVDITGGKKLGVLVKSSVTTSAGDLKLVYDDVENLGESFNPSKVLLLDDRLVADSFVPTAVWYRTGTTWTEKPNTADGVGLTGDTVTLTTTDDLMICAPWKFDSLTFDFGATVNLNAADITVVALTKGGVTSATLGTDGTQSAGKTFAQDGTITFTPPGNWVPRTLQDVTGYWVRLRPSASLTASIDINEITVSPMSVPDEMYLELTANQEAWVTLDIDPDQYPYPDETAVKSFGLKLATDLGAMNVELRGGVRLLGPDVTWYEFPIESKIINIEAYASSQTEELKNPWVFTEHGVFEIQQQNENQIVEMPLSEIAAFRSYENGLATCVNGPYLYFTLGKRIQRYYNRTLEDVSPDRADATRYRTPSGGLVSPPGISPLGNISGNVPPNNISGNPIKVNSGGGLKESLLGQPVKMISYPGKVIVAFDAGRGNDSLYSSIYASDSSGWHEIYTSDIDELQIRDIHFQALPWSTTGYLWMNHGDDLAYLTISDNPRNDSKYIARHEGILVSSWFHSNMYDIPKLWRSMKVFSENVGKAGSKGNVFVDYQLNYENEETDYSTVGEGTWTEIGQFFKLPSHELDILDGLETAPRGHRMRFRVRMYAPSAKLYPLLKALVVEAVAFTPVKYSISFNFILDDNIDDESDTLTNSKSRIVKLMQWANEGVELKWKSMYSAFDNWRVFIDPAQYSPLSVISDEGLEKYVGQLTLIQV